MRTNWRHLRETHSAYTVLPESDRYADVFEAIAEALIRGASYEPSPSDITTLAEWAGVEDPESPMHDMTLVRIPTTQVRVASAMQYVIGHLQYEFWNAVDRFVSLETPPDQIERHVILPDPVTLLKRKLEPTDAELTDLARFVVLPSYPDRTSWTGPDLSVLKFFEVRPDRRPASGGVVLREAQQRLHGQLAQSRTHRHGKGRRAKPSRFEKQVARLDALIATFEA